MSDIARDGKPNFKIGGAKPAPEPVPPVVEETLTLEEQEARLLAQLAAVKQQRAEAARKRREEEEEARKTRHIVLCVKALAGAMVLVESDFRDDIVEVMRLTPGRMYRGERENAIPVAEWDRTIAALKELPKLDIVFKDGVADAIEYHLHAPVWFIELQKRSLKVTPGPRANSYDLRDIPGLEWQGYKIAAHKWFTIPLSEAWSLYKCLEETEGVLWTDEAKEFTIRQLEMRGRLDEIGKATEMEYDANFVNDFKLRPFQGVGCNFIEATGGRALLAYEMGLGKTPMSLAYAWKNQFRTLIICPASLKANWCRQTAKFTGVYPNVLIGAEPTKFDLVQLLTSKQLFTVINYDILGRKIEFDDETTDEEGHMHVEHKVKYLWADVLNMAKFDCIIFDESHYIKNTDSNRSVAARSLKAPHVIHMTGTPVLNRPGELWPMLTMLQPDTFPSEDTFISQYTRDGKTAKNVEQLKEALKSIMIRRKHSDVRKDMPPLNQIEEYHDLSPKAAKLYRKVLLGVYEKIAAYDAKGRGGDEIGIASILAQIQRLKQVCAIDKVDRTAELAIELHESAQEERHNKVLIFSQYKGTAFAIAQRLGHEALCFVSRGPHDFVTADNNKRDELVQRFQKDDSIKYLVVTEKTAKEGHDITEAGFVIFNDLFWTPAAHDQAEGRAYMREIDPHGITSYYLITDKGGSGEFEIEEWIWGMLSRKQNVINATVEGVEAARDVSIATALIEKMRGAMWTRKKSA